MVVCCLLLICRTRLNKGYAFINFTKPKSEVEICCYILCKQYNLTKNKNILYFGVPKNRGDILALKLRIFVTVLNQILVVHFMTINAQDTIISNLREN